MAIIVNTAQRSVCPHGGADRQCDGLAHGRLGGGLSLERDAVEPVEPMLRHVVAELQTNAPDRVIETHFALTVPVNCDRRRIGQLASNLLGNALTYGAPDKPIRMGASTMDGWFELFVANAGDPIPPAALEGIFQPFTRGRSPRRQGWGLGLIYPSRNCRGSRRQARHVVSTPAETRFTFRMPLSL